MSDEQEDALLTDDETPEIPDDTLDDFDGPIPEEPAQEIPAGDDSGDIYADLQRQGIPAATVQRLRERTVSKADFMRETQARDAKLNQAMTWIQQATPILQAAQAQQPKPQDPVESVLGEIDFSENPQQREFLQKYGNAILERARQENAPIKQRQQNDEFEQYWSKERQDAEKLYGKEYVAQHEPAVRQAFHNYYAQGGIVDMRTLLNKADPEGSIAAIRKHAQAVAAPTKKPVAMTGFGQESAQLKSSKSAPMKGALPKFKDPTFDLMKAAEMHFAETRQR